MLPYRDSRITRIVLIIFFLLVLGYAFFEGRSILYGPTIRVDTRVMEVFDSFITIEGEAQRIATLTMNGTTIPITEHGAFSEPYILVPGYNRIVLAAHDRFGKTAERVIEIVYTPSSAPDSAKATMGKKASEGRPSTSATSSPTPVAPEE